jgi:hypothetical protein
VRLLEVINAHVKYLPRAERQVVGEDAEFVLAVRERDGYARLEPGHYVIRNFERGGVFVHGDRGPEYQDKLTERPHETVRRNDLQLLETQ